MRIEKINAKGTLRLVQVRARHDMVVKRQFSMWGNWWAVGYGTEEAPRCLD